MEPAGTVTFDGDHIGLYGGTLNTTTCDKGKLILFLTQNPDKGAAWAGVLGIPATQIPAYVTGLTSVLLRSDTLVTNHGYANGLATVIPAVLQARHRGARRRQGLSGDEVLLRQSAHTADLLLAGLRTELLRADVARVLGHVDHDHPEQHDDHQHLHARRPADEATVRTSPRERRHPRHADESDSDDRTDDATPGDHAADGDRATNPAADATATNAAATDATAGSHA